MNSGTIEPIKSVATWIPPCIYPDTGLHYPGIDPDGIALALPYGVYQFDNLIILTNSMCSYMIIELTLVE